MAGGSDLSLPEDAAAEAARHAVFGRRAARCSDGGARRGERGDEGEGRRRRRRRGRGRRGRGEGRGEGSEMLPPRRSEEAPPPELEAEFDLDRDDELDLEAALGDELPDQPRPDADARSAAGRRP